MSVEFNHDAVMQMFEKKRLVFLTKTGHMGCSIAALNVGEDGERHVDTGLSSVSKQFRIVSKDTIRIEAPLSYDVYLERRFGIMKKTEDELIPYMEKFEVEAFG